MDDLPDLPFEKILSYLSLEDLLKYRAISRSWRKRIDSFRTKSLFYSERPSGFLEGKNQLVSGVFAQNFIQSTRFSSFFRTFGHSILANLKHLRLCGLRIEETNATAFAQTLHSFGQLEKLNILRFCCAEIELELSLPMLNEVELRKVFGLKKLTLDAPKLKEVKIWDFSFFKLNIVHVESIERLLTDSFGQIEVTKMKNLKFLFSRLHTSIDSTLLSSLEQLKEIHLGDHHTASLVFEQKRRYGRTELKIYQCGLLLTDQKDPAIHSLCRYLTDRNFDCLVQNQSRLADEIPLYQEFYCMGSQRVPRGSVELSIFKRFIDLRKLSVDGIVQDIQRFLDLLKNSAIVDLEFYGGQSPELFDRLPDHCAVQKLTSHQTISNLHFLDRLQHLLQLDLRWSLDAELIRQVFEKLEFLSLFNSLYSGRNVRIERVELKQFKITLYDGVQMVETIVSDLNAAVQLILSKG